MTADTQTETLDNNERVERYSDESVTIILKGREIWLHPPDDTEAKRAIPSVMIALKGAGVSDTNGSAVADFVKSGEPTLVGVLSTEPPPGAIEVRVEKDGSAAEVVLQRPVLGGAYQTEEDVKKTLLEAGVVHGIQEETIRDAIQRREYVFGSPLKVAFATPTRHGADAQITLLKVADKERAPTEGEYGRVDLRNLGVVNAVSAGEILAEKTPAEEGVPGMTVKGTPIGAKNGKDKSLPSGSGTTISSDGLALTAAIDGHLTVVNGRITVLPVFHVTGDVDYGVGNIDFRGDVLIEGSVRDGFKIEASGTVTVKGMIEGAEIRAGQDVEIVGGIQGNGKGAVFAGRNISVGFAEQCSLSAGGDIAVKNALFHSTVQCNGELTVMGGQKSQIAGGKVSAAAGMTCLTLGSEMGTKTEVAVGVSADIARKRDEFDKKIDAGKENLRKMDANLGFLKKEEASGQLTPERREMLIKLTRTVFSLRAEIADAEKQVVKLNETIERNRSQSAVRVKGICYPGVKVSVRGATYKVREEQRFCSFVFDEGEVALRGFGD